MVVGESIKKVFLDYVAFVVLQAFQSHISVSIMIDSNIIKEVILLIFELCYQQLLSQLFDFMFCESSRLLVEFDHMKQCHFTQFKYPS